MLKTRLKRLTEAVPYMEYLFPEVRLAYDREALLGKKFKDDPDTARQVLARARQRFESLGSWDHEALEAAARAAADELSLKAGDFFAPLRIAITGRSISLPLFETMELLGREQSLRRLDAAAGVLSPSSSPDRVRAEPEATGAAPTSPR